MKTASTGVFYLGPFCGGKLLPSKTTYENIEKARVVGAGEGEMQQERCRKLRGMIEMKCSQEFSAPV